jgi:hypothetical protein
MTQARIENKLKTIVTLPAFKGKFPSVVIPPGGAKTVPDAYIGEWSKLKPKLVSYLRGMVSREELVITRASEEGIEKALARPDVPLAPQSLDGLQERGALLMIEEEDNGDTLRNWLQGERREDIKAAIKAKLIRLTPDTKPKTLATPPPLKF